MEGNAISLENVNLVYNEGLPTRVSALDGVTFAVKEREYAALFGPSGCGKSSALSIIAGIEKPDSGNSTVAGNDLSTLDADSLADFRNRKVGIIFQQFNLIPSLNILDNIALPLVFLGIPRQERMGRAKATLERLSMTEYATRYPDELSGGQQQRAGIARALVNDPPIILADEPLGSLDSSNAEKVLEFLLELNKKDGRTIVLVTHETWSLRDAQRIIYMKDGKIVDEKLGINTKEHEEHYQSLYPDGKAHEVKAKWLTELMLKGLVKEEKDRFEITLRDLLEKRIDATTFEAILDKPWSDGGVGLWRQTAKRLTKQITSAIDEDASLKMLSSKLKDSPTQDINVELSRARAWLLAECGTKIDSADNERLNQAIKERLLGKIDSAFFFTYLDTPRRAGGFGLRKRTAAKMRDVLDSILG